MQCVRTGWTSRALGLALVSVIGGLMLACSSDHVTRPSVSTVTVHYCPGTEPLWFAMQDGASGAWQQVLPTASGGSTFELRFTSGLGAVAAVEGHGPPFFFSVLYASAAELNAYYASGGCLGSNTAHGTIAGRTDSEYANVQLSTGPSAYLFPGDSNAYVLDRVPDGVQDLGAELQSTPGLSDLIILRRGITPANGATLDALDFASSEAFAPDTAILHVTGLGTDIGSVFSQSLLVFPTSRSFVGKGSIGYRGLPVDKLAAGEAQRLAVGASAPTATGQVGRSVTLYYRDVRDRSLALGAALASPVVSTVASAPYMRMRAQLPSQTDYPLNATAIFLQHDRISQIILTAAYLGGTPATTWEMTVPDVSGVAGFDVTWGLQAGQETTWFAAAAGGYDAMIPVSAPVEGSLGRDAEIQFFNTSASAHRTQSERRDWAWFRRRKPWGLRAP